MTPLLLTCALASVPTQQSRVYGNALLKALSRGRLLESGEGLGQLWSGPPAPNAALSMPASPLMSALGSTFEDYARLEAYADGGGTFTSGQASRYDALRRHLDDLKTELRGGVRQEPQGPTVAGLYALHVPHVALLTPTTRVELLPGTFYREVTVHDADPVWPLLSARLADPRKKGPAFKFDRASGTLRRDDALDKRLAEWLTATAAALKLHDLVGKDHLREEAAPTPDPYAARVWLGTEVY